jgi:stress-induced morphogen
VVTPDQLTARIKETIPSAVVKAQDLTGGGDHWRLEIVAEEFRDLSMVEQHQLVYKALGEWMSGPIHALSLDTSAP